jgi:predicted DNA-binding protein
MAVSEAQRKAHEKYFAKAYSQVKLAMPNDEAQRLDAFCAEHGYTKAGFIRTAIKEKMERENGQPVEE